VRQCGSVSGPGFGRYVMVEARCGFAIMERRFVNILVNRYLMLLCGCGLECLEWSVVVTRYIPS
jgi:hypothetical protein